jgi:hypothetical protein
MMILYLLLLLLLVLARLFVASRAKSLEKKYVRAAGTARELLTQPVYKNGNSNRTDATLLAKQQYLLGQVVEKRDRIEGRYLAWQARSDRLGKLLVRIRNWKGRMVPYLGGVIDVGLALLVLNMLGILEWPALSELIASLTSKWSG